MFTWKKKRRKLIQNSPQTDGFCACLIIEIFSNNTGECLKLLAGMDWILVKKLYITFCVRFEVVVVIILFSSFHAFKLIEMRN